MTPTFRFLMILSLSLFLISCNNDNKQNKLIVDTVKNDQQTVLMLRSKLDELHQQLLDSKFIKNPHFNPLSDPYSKSTLLDIWKTYLDYVLVSDSLYRRYDSAETTTYVSESDIFSIKYAIFLLQYRYAMQIIFELERHKALHTLLNEAIPELGLDKGSYSKIKYRFLNVIIATEFSRLQLQSKNKLENSPLTAGIQSDEAFIWNAAKKKGPYETIKNGLVITKDSFKTLLFPIKKQALSVGKYKVRRFGQYLISDEDTAQIGQSLHPGDILVTRREWHISNLGIPGFWTHAALFVGSINQRKQLFNTQDIKHWVKSKGEPSGSFEALLKRKFPEHYNTLLKNPSLVTIESYSPGVTQTALSFSVNADSVGGIRPNTSLLTKAIAVYNAFYYLGRPYDFDFDFISDQSLVCSELVVKCYSKTDDAPQFTGSRIMGKEVVSPNDFVKQAADEQHFASPHLEAIFFYDGSEKLGQSKKASLDTFFTSWKRPKWHILFH